MAKSRESNREENSQLRLPATVSTLHPADFPIGSAESRAAARALLRPGRLRAGDQGKTEEGGFYIIVKKNPSDPKDSRLLKIIFPATLSELRPQRIN